MGEALHPEREPLASLVTTKRTIGEYDFASQYQQTPMPVGGNIVKSDWLARYRPSDLPDRPLSICQSWDTANKATELNDYSVCTTWAAHDNKFYLLDVFRRRMNYPELKRAVRQRAEKFGATVILIEDKASGTQLLQELESECLCGLVPYQPPAGSDKVMRLRAQTALFESGRVVLPETAPYLDAYISELTGFPGTKYADQVDSTSQALDYLKSNYTLFVWERLGSL
jgi:predicted phage terminase large subunit-like protein